MKKKLLNLLFVIFQIFIYYVFSSCQEDHHLEIDNQILSRSEIIPNGTQSETNPYLIDDWMQTRYITLHTGQMVTAPWISGTSSDLPENFRKDVDPNRGWTMLFHTFDRLNTDPTQNFMVFYNLFTGYLKVFYYLENTYPCTNTIWYISADSAVTTKFLNPPDFISSVDAALPVNAGNNLRFPNLRGFNLGGTLNSTTPGWNGFEFQVAQYSNDLPMDEFTIGTYNQQVLQMVGSGAFDGNISGAIISKTAPKYSNGTSDSRIYLGLAEYVGSQAEGFINGLVEQSDKTEGSKTNIGKDLVGVLASAAKGDIIGILKGGWNMIFGRSTLTHYETTSDVRLSSNGSITIGADLTNQTSSPIPPLSICLKKILRAQTTMGVAPYERGDLGDSTIIVPNLRSNNRRISRPVTLQNLGTWTIKDSVETYWSVNKRFMSSQISNEGGDWIVNGIVPLPTMESYNFDIIVNPYLEEWVQNISTDVKFMVYSPSGPFQSGAFEPAPAFFHLLFKNDERFLTYLPEGNAEISSVFDYSVTEFAQASCPTDGADVYIRWNLPTYQILALITVKMDVEYLGNSFSVEESRVYPVKVNKNPGFRLPEHVLELTPGNTWITSMFAQPE